MPLSPVDEFGVTHNICMPTHPEASGWRNTREPNEEPVPAGRIPVGYPTPLVTSEHSTDEWTKAIDALSFYLQSRRDFFLQRLEKRVTLLTG